MNIHEYQAKDLLRQYNIPVLDGGLATTVEEACTVAAGLAGKKWIVKAQIHAGGRGKGGGIRMCHSLEELRQAAASILGMQLVTPQTGAAGTTVRRIWVEEAISIAKELYLAVFLDLGAQRLAVMASPYGGMHIEKLAQSHPACIHTCFLDASHHLWPFQARQLFFSCGLSAPLVKQGVQILARLVALCVEKDITQLEINPLALTQHGSLVALDAKISFDDSALGRHPDMAALADPAEADPLELQAAALGLQYIRLDGSIATMVNGAGLAMATMDAVKQAGAAPANFLDTGGGASVEMIRHGCRIMLADPRVRGAFVHIFGGILRCDIVATGLVQAVQELGATVPIVIRMEGTNVEEGRRILQASGLTFLSATSMAEAARLLHEKTGGAPL